MEIDGKDIALVLIRVVLFILSAFIALFIFISLTRNSNILWIILELALGIGVGLFIWFWLDSVLRGWLNL
jgi:hypothetical protein